MKEGKRVCDHVSCSQFQFRINFIIFSAMRRSPRKCEKRPIFVLNLAIPTRHIDNCLEPAKSAVHIEVRNLLTSDRMRTEFDENSIKTS